jgi:TPR repeat protein
MNTPDSRERLDKARAAIEKGDFVLAENLLDDLAHAGNADAMFLRAQFGTSQEPEHAFNERRIRLLTDAAKLGHAGAAYQLSIHLEGGDAVPEDKVTALELLRQAASLGHPNAVWRIGLMHIHGTGSESGDVKLGIQMIEQAAALKSQGALRTLADFYAEGKFGFRQDAKEAERLLKAAEEDDVCPL